MPAELLFISFVLVFICTRHRLIYSFSFSLSRAAVDITNQKNLGHSHQGKIRFVGRLFASWLIFSRMKKFLLEGNNWLDMYICVPNRSPEINHLWDIFFLFLYRMSLSPVVERYMCLVFRFEVTFDLSLSSTCSSTRTSHCWTRRKPIAFLSPLSLHRWSSTVRFFFSHHPWRIVWLNGVHHWSASAEPSAVRLT